MKHEVCATDTDTEKLVSSNPAVLVWIQGRQWTRCTTHKLIARKEERSGFLWLFLRQRRKGFQRSPGEDILLDVLWTSLASRRGAPARAQKPMLASWPHLLKGIHVDPGERLWLTDPRGTMTLWSSCSNKMCSSHDAVRTWMDIEYTRYKGKTKKKLTTFGLKERTVPGFFQTTAWATY